MSLASIMIVILFILLLFFLTLIVIGLRKQSTPTPLTPGTADSATPKVSILKKIPLTAVGIVLIIILIIAAMIYIGDKIIKSDEERKEMNAFRVENSTGVSISSGNNYLAATGGAGGGTITIVSEERNPPCVYFNFSGGNSTFEVTIDGVLYGKVYQFSNLIGTFNTCHYKAKDGDNEKKLIKIEVVVESGDKIKIENYKVWEKY
jgi:predicted secreted protein